jgi:K+-transporting ATPase A subunit
MKVIHICDITYKSAENNNGSGFKKENMVLWNCVTGVTLAVHFTRVAKLSDIIGLNINSSHINV